MAKVSQSQVGLRLPISGHHLPFCHLLITEGPDVWAWTSRRPLKRRLWSDTAIISWVPRTLQGIITKVFWLLDLMAEKISQSLFPWKNVSFARYLLRKKRRVYCILDIPPWWPNLEKLLAHSVFRNDFCLLHLILAVFPCALHLLLDTRSCLISAANSLGHSPLLARSRFGNAFCSPCLILENILPTDGLWFGKSLLFTTLCDKRNCKPLLICLFDRMRLEIKCKRRLDFEFKKY